MTAGNNFVRTKAKPLPKYSIDFNKIQKAKIKSVVDVSHNGKLLVWLIDSNTNEDLKENWVSVNYASPFAGSTDREKVNRRQTESFEGTQKSYGFFAVPPDINNYVLVVFANGDPTQGYWIASIYHDSQTQMVVGIAASKNSGTTPVAEMNIYSGQIGSPQQVPKRPTHKTFYDGLVNQGLINDPLRGAGTSSVWRDNVPSVLGLLSPGGSQWIIDDNPTTKLIRFRTVSGAQILISETDGQIYLISKSGNSWVELSNDGNIFVYGSQSVSIRADKDLNLSAGGSVNIQSGTGAINLKSGSSTVNVQANGQINLRSMSGDIIGTAGPGKNIYFSGPTADTAGSPVIIPTHEPWIRP